MKKNSFSRTHSRTRTNSSSSSGSSALTSPVAVQRTNSDTPSPSQPFIPPQPSYYGLQSHTPPGANGRRQSLGSSSTNSSPGILTHSQSSSSHYTPSEAAALAALKSINGTHTTSVNQPFDNYLYSDSNSGFGPPLAINPTPILASPSGLITNTTRNKISAAAAASAAVFASKPKESALTKAKLFARQATKPHTMSNSTSSSSTSNSSSKKKNIDLTIQTSLPPLTGRPTIAERSPLTRPSKELERIASIGERPAITRPSKELERIASIGSLTTLIGSERINPNSNLLNNNSNITLTNNGTNNTTTNNNASNVQPEKTIKHHLTFRPRKDSHGLSSSSSNSKLISEQGSIYSFHPSSPGMVPLELKNMGNTKEERDQVLDGSWTLLRSRVISLFSGEGLRTPVEDLNKLILMHMSILIQQGGTARMIINEFKELLRAGMYSFDVNLIKTDDSKLLQKLAELWIFFFNEVLPYLEAIFLPLQSEFQGTGKIIPPEDAPVFWRDILAKDSLDTRRFILMGFRDYVVIPVSNRLEVILLDNIHFDDGISVLAVRILQCTNVLSLIQSGNSNQSQVDHLSMVVRNSWLSRPRTGKDRRGVVMSRKGSKVMG